MLKVQNIIFVVVIVALSVFSYNFAKKNYSTPDAFENLKKARNALGKRQFDIAFNHALEARKEPLLKNWALLTLGDVKRELGETGDAFNYYSRIKTDSAAFPDALLATLIIKKDLPRANGVKEKITKTSLALTKTLADLIKKSDRDDLNKYLLLLHADQAAEQKSYSLAISQYNEIRAKFPGTNLAKLAKEKIYAIRKKENRKSYNFSLAEQLIEANLLIDESDYQAAKKIIDEATKSTVETSAPRLDILLAKEKLLRKLNQPLEADKLLKFISSRNSYGASDRATLQLAENAWRKNQSEAALSYSEQLLSKFPKSHYRSDALYIKGRALEEINKSNDALAVYQQISKSYPNSKNQVLALKRSAWLNLLNNDFLKAELEFKNLRKISEYLATAPESNESDRFKYKDDFLHALYWQGFTLSKLKNSSGEIAEDLWQDLTARDPYGYYGMLAKQALGISPNIDKILNNEQQAALTQSCLTNTTEENSTYFKNLKQSELQEILDAEIGWLFVNNNSSEPIAPSEDLKQQMTKASLFSQYSEPKRTAIYALKFLKNNSANLKTAELSDCADLLVLQAFPTPFNEIYKKYSEENNLSPTLALAVSRTESLFEPNAISKSDARGLMQLLVPTAIAEGLQKNETLFDPETNIRLGTRYLSNLNKQLKNETKAIAAYNAGPTAVNKWIKTFPNLTDDLWIEMISYAETRDYVKRVKTAQWFYQENPSFN